MQSGNAFGSNVATSEQSGSLQLEIDNLEIKNSECFPHLKCIHINFPGKEILQATLAKYRKKPRVLEMVNAALDFDASSEELEKPLFFFFDNNSVRTMWECINMHSKICLLKSESHTKITISKCWN